MRPAVLCWLLVLCAIGGARAYQESLDPDSLYRAREDIASAKRAADLWEAAEATDFEAAWKLTRASYWLGTRGPEPERRRALERGIAAGERAVRLQPDRPEGHFWLAAVMGMLAESYGVPRGLKYRGRIKSELERVIAIDPDWESASAETALGRWYYVVPRLFGGNRTKAGDLLRDVVDRFPQNKTALSFLADVMIAQRRMAEARALLQRVLDEPDDPNWLPEDRDFERKALRRLKVLPPGDK